MAPSSEQMAAVHRLAFQYARPWSAQEFADLLAQKGCFAVGDTVCFAVLRVIGPEAELLTIATHPEHQNCGHGHRLMSVWQQKACELGAQEAFLEVAADNIPARALYARSGFENAGLRKNYYQRTDGMKVDAIVMRRSLT